MYSGDLIISLHGQNYKKPKNAILHIDLCKNRAKWSAQG